MLQKQEVIDGMSKLTRWWLLQRLEKLRSLGHETMAINPFMAPLVVGLHSHSSFDELAELLLDNHFMVGHATGFGKLVDEKILPAIFKTTKLDAAYRRTAPFNLSVFSEIDHIVQRGGERYLLSLKASRWTIQLTMAMQLNRSFKELIELRQTRPDVKFTKIVVGVIYGTADTLTDKFSIIRGILRRTQHDVHDIASEVEVVTGRELWAWLNEGESQTQDWMMDGILDCLQKEALHLKEAEQLREKYKSAFTKQFDKYIDPTGKIDWHAILASING